MQVLWTRTYSPVSAAPGFALTNEGRQSSMISAHRMGQENWELGMRTKQDRMKAGKLG